MLLVHVDIAMQKHASLPTSAYSHGVWSRQQYIELPVYLWNIDVMYIQWLFSEWKPHIATDL